MALPGLKTTFSILHFTDCFPPGGKDTYLNDIHLPRLSMVPQDGAHRMFIFEAHSTQPGVAATFTPKTQRRLVG